MADSVVPQRARAPYPTWTPPQRALVTPRPLTPASPPVDLFTRGSSVKTLRAADAAKRELVLKWHDEFDGPAGSPPDPRYWTHEVGGDGWGNNQLEYDTDSTRNVALDGKGCLAITGRREAFGNRAFTSARIKTQGKVEALYGRVEARIKLPPGQGLWPAFWMLGNDIDKVGWPQCSETDIMEYQGQKSRVLFGTIHGPGYSGADGIGTTYTLPEGGFDKDFHTFTVDWDPAKIVFAVDGEVYQTITREQVTKHGPWVFDHPQFIILNLAIGGGFVGSPDESTPFPATMLVDWVRVYDKKPVTS